MKYKDILGFSNKKINNKKSKSNSIIEDIKKELVNEARPGYDNIGNAFIGTHPTTNRLHFYIGGSNTEMTFAKRDIPKLIKILKGIK
jgi:hypothetical protein